MRNSGVRFLRIEMRGSSRCAIFERVGGFFLIDADATFPLDEKSVLMRKGNLTLSGVDCSEEDIALEALREARAKAEAQQ
jgi:hypothetical protein